MQQKLPGCKYRIPTVVSPFAACPAIALSLDLPSGYWTLQPFQDIGGIQWDRSCSLAEEEKQIINNFAAQYGQTQQSSPGIVISWQEARNSLHMTSGHPLRSSLQLAALIIALNDWYKHPLNNAELLSWLNENTESSIDGSVASLIYGGMVQYVFEQVQRVFLPSGTNWLLEQGVAETVTSDISAADLVAILLALHSGNHNVLIESSKHYSPGLASGVLLSTSLSGQGNIRLHLLSISDPSPEWLSGQFIWAGPTGMDGVKPV